jgi:glycosyltransferase involved in cell wall biosynthesis
VFEDFEVIVILDEPEPDEGIWHREHESLYQNLDNINLPVDVLFSGGGGPNSARNRGTEHAKGDIILILGSDCIPDPNLVAEHYYSHIFENADVVQGMTPFYPDVITDFYDFLDTSGLQAAWSNLKDENGNFRRVISPAFCLTTNYSIKRQLLLNEPFDERFTGPAWDDIDEGYRLSKYNEALKTVFNYNAINYHYHRYGLDSFVQRSRMEGYHRLTICKIHPEMGWNMVNPFDLRVANDIDEVEMLSWAKELDNITSIGNEDIKDFKERRYQRYAEVCKVYSLKGVLDRIKDEHPAMQALLHVHDNSTVIQILSGVNALDSGHLGYCQHAREWSLAERPENWALHSFGAEIDLECGNTEEAIAGFRKSLEISPSAEWPKKRLKEVLA